MPKLKKKVSVKIFPAVQHLISKEIFIKTVIHIQTKEALKISKAISQDECNRATPTHLEQRNSDVEDVTSHMTA